MIRDDPAPGRTVHPLAPGWTAVVLRPLPDQPLTFVGVFRDGCDAPEVILDRPADVRRFLDALGRSRNGAYVARRGVPY
jgi:hypothetical protein